MHHIQAVDELSAELAAQMKVSPCMAIVRDISEAPVAVEREASESVGNAREDGKEKRGGVHDEVYDRQ